MNLSGRLLVILHANSSRPLKLLILQANLSFSVRLIIFAREIGMRDSLKYFPAPSRGKYLLVERGNAYALGNMNAYHVSYISLKKGAQIKSYLISHALITAGFKM